MDSPHINKNVEFIRNLYAANGGIAITSTSNAHSDIKLHPTANNGTVSFPFAKGSKGKVADEYGDNAFVVRLECKTGGIGLYSYQTVNLVINKASMGFFFKYLD